MSDLLTVSALNRAVCASLERQFPLLWVGGEVSNFTRAASGHWYFSLKDAGAQVRAVMFKGRAQLTDFVPREGDKVEVRCRITLYEPRGDLQIGVESMRRAGAGDLNQAFERLRQKLATEGLFDADRKRPLPEQVRTIGVVTSAQGAALRDVIATVRARAPHVRLIIYPTLVQGAAAPDAIIQALGAAQKHRQADVLLIVRGGGSVEDLWAFNDELVARAIAECSIMTISGVGHETDFTICDFVADLRAPTPTAAANAAAPDCAAQIDTVNGYSQAIARRMRRKIEGLRQRLDFAARLLRSPAELLATQKSQIVQKQSQLRAAMGRRRQLFHNELKIRERALRLPSTSLQNAQIEQLLQRLIRAKQANVRVRHDRLARLAEGMRLVDPLAVLGRGYAIVSDQNGSVIFDPQSAAAGDLLSIRLHGGILTALAAKDAI